MFFGLKFIFKLVYKFFDYFISGKMINAAMKNSTSMQSTLLQVQWLEFLMPYFFMIWKSAGFWIFDIWASSQFYDSNFTIVSPPSAQLLRGQSHAPHQSMPCKLGVKIWNLKIDFKTGGTWRRVRQWTLIMNIYDFFYST